MSQFFRIHPETPQVRLVRQAVGILNAGGVIAYPTDSAYALGCHIGDKQALQKIRQVRRLDADHHFSLVCRDLSDLGVYAKVSNTAYRMLKAATPGAYTFVLPATREVPRRLVDRRRKTIGLRVPDNEICRALLSELGEPIMSSTLILPDESYPMTDPLDIRDELEHQVDLVIDGGFCGMETTTVVDLEGDVPLVLREGMGAIEPFVS
ncbi:MAG: threonylcarbamoyl-AMP synthase [Gammaproteobacteria bacterium]|uniref:Threonylcarbamoyl-AMP synthase n=1 Tax=OM182 bacterium MED-G24 TaxID=1986255 RepID=A0A2A5WV75_9GAMM|nr:threonylcarbamoyl-AMP synthase [Gammaproteobacteria bacterium]PDH40127.1 MAG: threonylcarbamoyl-AMP synthase [OM182 bacterium MED-G24]RPG26114.1 MAG: threonylcarbamoyl-AMP synthase [Gammaproteobacteria bacterium TMED50]|tara:strand:+ start:1221 stop:1844 length:624 start_codon:yes stop_codon:yes gene_type:complete